MRQRYSRLLKGIGSRSIPVLALGCCVFVLLPLSLLRSQSRSFSPDLLPGQSVTLLSDGRLLLIGGQNSDGRPLGTASIYDPNSGTGSVLSAGSSVLKHPRAWHSATMLPNGKIFIFGGVGSDDAVLSAPEIFDPSTLSFFLFSSSAGVNSLLPRSHHTATLLTNGQLLVAGGVGADGRILSSAQIVSAGDQPSIVITRPLSDARRDHRSNLLADGTVLLWGGVDSNGDLLNTGDQFNPSNLEFSQVYSFELEPLKSEAETPYLAASIPFNNSVDVPVDTTISLRFSKRLAVESVNPDTVVLSGPSAIEPIDVVPAENGMLAFITPKSPLFPGSTYTVTINGLADSGGLLLPLSGFSFTTEQTPAVTTAQSDSETHLRSDTSSPPQRVIPFQKPEDDDWEWKGERRDGKPYSQWQDLPPLMADPGITALAGQVLDLRGEPLENVTLRLSRGYGYGAEVQTDATGRFLLTEVTSGWGKLTIDGRRARRRVIPQSSALGPEQNHGVFEYGRVNAEGITNVLPFTIWLPKIDTAHVVHIESPTTAEVVVTTHRIRGLELKIPGDTVIYDHEGSVVSEVSLTPVPLDRTPFPLPNIEVPIYFTAQPGGAYLSTSSEFGARIHYPNNANQLPGSRFQFWHYDPGYQGWYVYGLGTVAEDGKQVIPDPGISVYRLTGAMVSFPGAAAAEGPRCLFIFICNDGDPVNLDTGLFVLHKTDLYLPDVIPVSLTRTYRPRDTMSRAFGIGATHPYEMFLIGDTFPYTYVELVLPDGGRIHYDRISSGTGFADAVYENTNSPTHFHKSKISWNGNGWNLRLKDGTVYVFGDSAPLQSIRDRYHNQITILRSNGQSGNITRIISPHERWIEFTYGPGNRISQAQDNIGRTVNYEYDGTGRLIKVTDPNGGVTEHAYDTSSRMLTIKDARGIVFLTNEYDTTGKVISQNQADGSTYQFAYTNDSNGKIIQTDVTDPRGNIRRVTFNSDGQILTDTRALGTPEEQVKTYQREVTTNLLISETDAINRTTNYTHDQMGNITSLTRLAGTSNAVTTTYTYEPNFNQLASVTDPVNHTTNFGYDIKGNLVSITNALDQTTIIARNAASQPVAITDPLNNTTHFSYNFGDLAAITDPLGSTTTRFADAAGRVLGMTNPLRSSNIYDYDVLNRLVSVTDPLSGVTGFGYDPNGNLLSVTDARNNVTAYTYDDMDRLATRTDPVLGIERYQYDLAGNLSQFTNRNNQPTVYSYDALNRRTGITYADGSTTTYSYDSGNRLTQVQDSVTGTILRTYDGLDRLTSETTPQGSVIYTYDAVGRRTNMTVAGQPTVNYLYDNANRLIQITQGSAIVSFTYDAAGRRTSVTLPNGILVEYAYDAASRITGITYKQNETTLLGDLTYEYDKAGNRTKIGGSFARTGVPQSIASTGYNAANQQIAFGDRSLSYDHNGNLVNITDSNGTTIYTWNARNQLIGISGPGVEASFVYDGLGRRQKKTINGALTEFLYDGLNPVQETSGAAVLANVLPGRRIDELLARADLVTGVTNYFLSDALGSTLALTDSDGMMQTEYTYEPFGRTTVLGVSNTNPFQYTGRENDGTGLYYYRARYYDPNLQRFISEDAFNVATIQVQAPDELRSLVTHEYLQEYFTSANLYLYVDNTPLVSTDPLGLFCGAAVFGTTLGGQIAGNSALGAGLGALGGAFGARKPVNGAGLGIAAGKTIGALAALTPLGVPGAFVGGMTGAFMGAAVGGAAGGTAGSMMIGALAGAVGGAAGGAIGGHCGTIAGTAAGMWAVMAFGIL